MQKLSKVFDFKFIITFLLIFIPLFPKFPAFRIPGIYVSIRLEDFLILFSLLSFSFMFFKKFKELLSLKVARAIFIFLAIGLISTLSGIFLTKTVELNIGLLHWLRRVEYFSLFFIGYLYLRYSNITYNFFEYLIKIILIVNLFIFLYALGQRYLEFPVVTTQNEEYSKGIALRWVPGSHINSTFAGHYDLASYLVLTIPMLVTSFFVFKDKILKILTGFSILTSFWLFAYAASRISVVAFLIACSLSLFIYKKYKEIVIFAFISLLAFGFSPDLKARYIRIYEVVKDKISSIVVVNAQEENPVFEDRSTSIRFNVEWPRAIRALSKNPLLGTGYSSITLATDNDYLRMLGEVGILGFSAFVLLFINIYQVFKNFKFDNNFSGIFKAGFIGSTVAILMTAVFIDIFEASKFASVYWLFLGFSLGVKENYE